MRLNHVILIVGELRRSLRFYRALGLVPIVHEAPRYVRLHSADGDWTPSIEVTGDASLPARVQLYFECDALDERVALLRAAGLRFRLLPTDMDYRWREARLSDPDDHELRLSRAGRNRLYPLRKVAPADVPD
jgi:catechol 2,3-dioxygenase-like lactoylglutathione lyase family enzyme